MEVTIDFCTRGSWFDSPSHLAKNSKAGKCPNLCTKIDFPETCYFCELDDLETLCFLGKIWISRKRFNLWYVLSYRLAGVPNTERGGSCFHGEFLAVAFRQRAHPRWKTSCRRVGAQRVSRTGRVYYIGPKLNHFKDAGSRTLTVGATWRVSMYNTELHLTVSRCSVMEITIGFCTRGSWFESPSHLAKNSKVGKSTKFAYKNRFPRNMLFLRIGRFGDFFIFWDFFMSHLSHPEKVFFSAGSGSFPSGSGSIWLGSDPEPLLGSGSTSRAVFGLRINLRIDFSVWLR